MSSRGNTGRGRPSDSRGINKVQCHDRGDPVLGVQQADHERAMRLGSAMLRDAVHRLLVQRERDMRQARQW